MTDYLAAARDIVASVNTFNEIEAVDLALALGADYTEIDTNVLRIEPKESDTFMLLTLARGHVVRTIPPDRLTCSITAMSWTKMRSPARSWKGMACS